ncbi:YcgN family cysteine cluster protein [Halomonas denitrificans]|uniref:YcgN family cysteine cluster protein n=1 Tax=Halomonas TaxID=2745 RepID=UPI001A8E7443|nr:MULTISPECIES: YcgN family cysteine cluster protein [Halomonas]MED5296697.1 YcgN family cysteine cluster protein [Pseudomonadota bacterium]MBN8410677.1 YcgN family cysteine cluster protein [Halomonas litopenaei]MBY5969280.1 YcgN family cysteine cluster protein [Halomonas denitrificans]MBY5984907.1 YcgN family cysteine cluster protein [Halomonas sp. DP5Y7-2]MBY6030593.1 YcgN family cysteine cluster protein [Halomonas sp. DP8Y7-1]
METSLRERFWERYSLHELNPQEWEALCDGCGQCCLRKLEDEDTGDLAVLGLACRLLDVHSCRCSDYENRFAKVPDCTQLTPELAHQFTWLPHSCAYRRLAEGRKLAGWHHLICGDRERVHRKGISVRSFAISETEVDEADFEDHIIAVIPVDG